MKTSGARNHFSFVHYWLGAGLLLLATAAVDAAAIKPNQGAREVKVMTQNLYVGSEFDPVLALDPSDPNYQINFLLGVAEVYQRVLASDFSKRGDAIAERIAAQAPDLIGLQEVTLVRAQTPGDLVIGGTTPATDVQVDFLAVVLGGLAQRGAHYAVVSVNTNYDFELPMPTMTPGLFVDVRLTDFNVILARTDRPPGHLRVFNAQAGTFETDLPLPTLGSSVVRGWCSVDVTLRGRTFRFINAHLEEETSPLIQAAQGLELLSGPADVAMPVILVGDFNSDAYGQNGTTTYQSLTQVFADAWSGADAATPGLTWGPDPFLADPSRPLEWRVDLILLRGERFHAVEAEVMDGRIQNVPPLWASDHAGVAASIRIK